jgi:hypothetical protein
MEAEYIFFFFGELEKRKDSERNITQIETAVKKEGIRKDAKEERNKQTNKDKSGK